MENRNSFVMFLLCCVLYCKKKVKESTIKKEKCEKVFLLKQVAEAFKLFLKDV